jgi:hypothetical protein
MSVDAIRHLFLDADDRTRVYIQRLIPSHYIKTRNTTIVHKELYAVACWFGFDTKTRFLALADTSAAMTLFSCMQKEQGGDMFMIWTGLSQSKKIIQVVCEHGI